MAAVSLQVVGGAGGQRPRPPQAFVADPDGAALGERGAGVAQRFLRLVAGGGGEGFHDANRGLVLGVFAGPQVWHCGQYGLGGGGVAAQRRQPAPVASKVVVVCQSVGVHRLGELLLGGVPVADHQQRLDQVPDRKCQEVPVAGPAQVPGRGAGGPRRRRGVSARHHVRQVGQRAAHAEVVAGLLGKPRGFAEVGDRLGAPPIIAEVDPAGYQQAAELVSAHAEGLAQGERLGGQPVRVGRAGEYLHDREFFEGEHRVGVGICPQHLHRGGELITRFGVAAPQPQGPPSGGLGAGRRPGLAALEVIIAGPVCVPHRRRPVGVGKGGVRGAFPQHASVRPPSRGFAIGSVRLPVWGASRAHVGGGGVAGGGRAGAPVRSARSAARISAPIAWPRISPASGSSGMALSASR